MIRYRDYFYLFLNDIFFAYIGFETYMAYIDKMEINAATTIGLVMALAYNSNKIRLKFKKSNRSTLPILIMELLAICFLYVWLLDYYHIELTRHQYIVLQLLNPIVFILVEAKYYFFSYEEIKEEQESSWFDIFKNKKSSDESHKTDEKE